MAEEHTDPSRRDPMAPAVAIGLVGWLLAAAWLLGGQPLGEDEAIRVFDAGGPSEAFRAAPLAAALLRAVRLLGPPSEVLLRLLGLAGLGLAALAAYRLCAEAGGSRRSGLAAAAATATSGALLLASAVLTAAAPLLGAEAIVALAALWAARGGGTLRALALASASAIAAALDLATLPLVVSAAAWLLLCRPRRPLAAGLALAATAAAVAGLLAGGLVPLLRPPVAEEWLQVAVALSTQLLGLGGEGFVSPPHPFLAFVAPAYGLALLGLAAAGAWKGTPAGARLLGLGLVASGLAMVLLHGPAGHGGGAGFLLLPGLFALGALRVGRAAAGPDRAFWVLLLVGLPLLSGVRVLAKYRHEETRAAAATLGPRDRAVTPREGLRLAVDFYRGPTGPGRTESVRIWRPGDREPRAVAVHALGRSLGRLWVVRAGQPLYDLGARLPEAVVTYTERGRVRPCPWQASRTRFHCGGPEYQFVARSGASFDGAEADAIYVHPLDDGVLEIRYRGIPLGRRLVGVAGLDDSSLDFSTAEVDLEVRVSGSPPLRLRRGRARGLVPFTLDTSRGPRRGDVVLRVTAEDDRGRHLFVDGLVME